MVRSEHGCPVTRHIPQSGTLTISLPVGVKKALKLFVLYGNIRTVPSPMTINAPVGNGPPQLPIVGAFAESRCNVTPAGLASPLLPDRMVPVEPPMKMFVDRATSAEDAYWFVLMLPCPTKMVLEVPSWMSTILRCVFGLLGCAASFALLM